MVEITKDKRYLDPVDPLMTVEGEAVELTYRLGKWSALTQSSLAIFVLFLLPPEERTTQFYAWFLILSTILIVRSGNWFLYMRGAYTGYSHRVAKNLFIIFSSASAFTWGMLPAVIGWSESHPHQSAVPIFMSALLAGAIACQSSIVVSSYLFVMCTLTPFITYLIWMQEPIFFTLAVSAYGLFLLGTARTIHGSFTRTLQLRAEKGDLITTLSRMNTALAENNKQLIAAGELAASASRAKSEFLARMSHEIRTPMNGIMGMTEIALDLSESNEQSECLQIVKQSAQSLLMIMNDVLDLSKIEAGKVSIQKAPFDLPSELRRIHALLAPVASQNGISLQLKIDTACPHHVIGDSLRFGQVLTNLITNGIKFSPTGGTVTVRAYPELTTTSRSRIRFAVNDTGIGINSENQAKIFEAFEQADNSNSRKYGGTGLGLTISSHLVELMGGRLELKSEIGEGAEFWFVLEFEHMERANSDHLPKLDSHVTHHRFHGVRVLLAEDNRVNQRVTQSLLERAGCTMCIVENGEEALHAMEERTFDIIILDCQMPVMDGYEASRRIRELEKEKGGHVPIIALTAHAMPEDKQHCLSVGMDEYLTKPINRLELIETVARVLKNSAEKHPLARR